MTRGKIGLLDLLWKELGTDYLSDLRLEEFRPTLYRLTASLDAEGFPLEEWTDALRYLSGRCCEVRTAHEAKEEMLRYFTP